MARDRIFFLFGTKVVSHVHPPSFVFLPGADGMITLLALPAPFVASFSSQQRMHGRTTDLPIPRAGYTWEDSRPRIVPRPGLGTPHHQFANRSIAQPVLCSPNRTNRTVANIGRMAGSLLSRGG